MALTKPYIGCKIGLLSKAQNRYEGILYTIDKINSTVVLAKVRCFGTEGRPTDRPTPPKDDVYEYITFRGSDIQDITMCEPPRLYHGLPPDPAIVQSSSASSSGIYSPLPPFSPLRMPAFNQLATSVLNQQYAAALGIGSVLQDIHVRRGPMVEKAVQTVQVERLRQRSDLTVPPEQQWDRRVQRTRPEATRTQRDSRANVKPGPVVTRSQEEAWRQNIENRPPPRRKQGPRRRRSQRRGQLMVANAPSPILKFDTDFDFDSSNAQFIKDQLEKEEQEKANVPDGNFELDGNRSASEDEPFGPKCYYDRTKSFYDNISSDNGFRLTWAEERKRNLETFGVPGRFFRGQSFRGGYVARRGRGAAQVVPSHRVQGGPL